MIVRLARAAVRSDRLVALAIGLLALSNGLLHGPWTGFNPDESRWISRAHFVRDLFDPFGPTWADSYTTRGQPPFGSYVTGLGLLGQGRDLDTNGAWVFHWPGTYGWERNIVAGNMPSADDLAAARRTSAGLVGLTAATLFAIGRRISTRAGAAAGALWFAVHPFSGYVGSLATSDAVLGLLVALAALAGAALAARPSWPRAALLGGLLGLGASAKLSPFFVSLPLATLGAALLIAAAIRARRVPSPRRDPLPWALIALPLVAAATFVASYPYLWPDPIGRTGNLFAFRIREMAQQSADWPVMAVPTRGEALRRVGVNFDERFSILGGLAAAAGLRGRPPAIELLLAVAGGVVLLGLAVARGGRSPTALVLLVLGGQVAVTVVGMRSEFDRYHVPMMLLGATAIGGVVGETLPRLGRLQAPARVASRIAFGAAPRRCRRRSPLPSGE